MNARPQILAVLLLAAPISAVAETDFNAYLAATTDYVFRGVSYSDGDPAAQLGLELSHSSGFFVGTWASTVDIGSLTGSGRDLEVRYYGGYTHELSSRWAVTATAIAYTFPGADGQLNYDFEEYGVSLNYDDRAWLEYAFAPDLFNAGSQTHNIELYYEWPLPLGMAAGAGAGWYNLSDAVNDDYVYWQAGLARQFGRLGLDLRYHDTSGWVPFFSDDERARQRLVLSASWSF